MLTDFGDIDDYHGCFAGNGWIKELHPDSWDHPARVAFGLSERIYKESLEKGWIKPNSTVLDPFCGVAGFGFHALSNGLDFVGVEIEPPYYEKACKNVDLWNERYAGRLNRWGTASIHLGDSTHLSDIVGTVGTVISSPTYSELQLHNPDPAAQQLFKEKSIFYGVDENYGKADGQTGNMKPDEYWRVQQLISDEIKNVLSPGGHLIWVVKRYVRQKRMVEFPTEWADFYTKMGFEPVAWRKAWQLEPNGKQYSLFGGVKENKKDHRSFFRSRHARMFPSLAIDWEDVIVFRNPEKASDRRERYLRELGYE